LADGATRESDMALRFRERHARLGVILSEAALGEVAAYAWLGHPHADRAALLTLSGSCGLASASLWVLGPVMARHRRHAILFVAWSAAVIASVLFGTILDGGERSPLALLLFLPMMYAALAYRPTVVLWLGGLEVLGYVVVCSTDDTPTTAYAAIMAGTVCVTVLMAAQAARLREQQARELHALAVRMEAEATRDGLTDCLNRRGFDAAFAAEVSRAVRYGRPLSLLLIDIDHLKSINDGRGHAGGDDALRQVASALRRAGRPNDIAARLGGDEFALLVPETAIEGALELARRMHTALRAGTGGAHVTVSIGAAALGPDITLAAQLMRAADNALYAAKDAGRDRTASYDVSTAAERVPTAVSAARPAGVSPTTTP
jgi:diguanylate cyclase (GGDEF)-like protein